MSSSTCSVGSSIVFEVVASEAVGGSREIEKTRWTKSIIFFGIPFIAQGSSRKGPSLSRALRGYRSIAPETHFPVGRGNLYRQIGVVSTGTVHAKQLASKCILRLSAIGWRTLRRVAPRTRPGRRIHWINGGGSGRGEQCLLVANQSAIGSVGSVDAVFPPSFPKELVAAKEGQIHACVTSRFDTGAFGPGDVLVMSDGQIQFVVLDESAAASGVNAAEVAYVVAVRLQPPHHRILGVKNRCLHLDRIKRAVVADFVGAIIQVEPGVVTVEAVASIVAVRLPALIRSLEEYCGFASVISYDEND